MRCDGLRCLFWLVLVFGLACFAYGEEGKVTGGDLKREAGETLDAAKKYALQQKAEYQKKIEQELAELGDRIASLKEKAANATDESLRVMREKMADLRERQATAEKKLAEVKSTTYQAWMEMRDGMDKAVSEVKKAYESASKLFK